MSRDQSYRSLYDEPINVQEFIARPIKTLELKKLMALSDILLLRIVHHLDDGLAAEIKRILLTLYRSSGDPSVQKWAKKTIKDHFCKKCRSKQLNRDIFPFCLCNTCKSSLVSDIKCLTCFRQFQDPDLRMPCNHLCKFCACMWIKKGYEHCPECDFDYLPLKSSLKQLTFTCILCETNKKLYQDTLFFLNCKHQLCGECFLSNPHLQCCKIDSKPYPSNLRPLFQEYLMETCSQCEALKLRSKFISKTCCPAYYQICKRCSTSSTCKICNNHLTLNQFTS
jgi:hypothetical protein